MTRATVSDEVVYDPPETVTFWKAHGLEWYGGGGDTEMLRAEHPTHAVVLTDEGGCGIPEGPYQPVRLAIYPYDPESDPEEGYAREPVCSVSFACPDSATARSILERLEGVYSGT